jgi:hypothetical protein
MSSSSSITTALPVLVSVIGCSRCTRADAPATPACRPL